MAGCVPPPHRAVSRRRSNSGCRSNWPSAPTAALSEDQIPFDTLRCCCPIQHASAHHHHNTVVPAILTACCAVLHVVMIERLPRSWRNRRVRASSLRRDRRQSLGAVGARPETAEMGDRQSDEPWRPHRNLGAPVWGLLEEDPEARGQQAHGPEFFRGLAEPHVSHHPAQPPDPRA